MREIVKIGLDNEMDLILAHKRTIKLSEMCGLSVPTQTSFATAVSEIARCSISSGSYSTLALCIDVVHSRKKEITAVITDTVDLKATNPQAFKYAKRLIGNFNYERTDDVFTVRMSIDIPYPGLISDAKVSSFKEYFEAEAPLSPYDEIRKKNIQLIELSEKLSESESKYRQLTDNLPQLIFAINNKNEIVFTNKWFRNYLGTGLKNFNRASLREIFHEDDISGLLAHWDTAKNQQLRVKTEVRLKNKEGYIWHLLSIVPQTAEEGEVLNWIGFLVDINAQKLVEETLKDNKELRLAQEKLQDYNTELTQKNNELERFAYVASHDLQEPLRKIKYFISLAERHITPEEKEKLYFNKISSSAERMSVLIRDILNYSKVSADEQIFVPVNMNDILKEVLVDFDRTIVEKEAKIKAANLPVVNGIPIQMNQMLYNLISNSLKFSVEKPVIDISYDLVQKEATELNELLLHNNDYHKISLKDNGIGIDEQYSKKIFMIFQRLHGRGEFEGTGIGLALCKKIAENHKGAIRFKSTPGKGTTFDVYIPA